jgi:hypothetical protein
MKSLILLYKGPATPADATHEGWPEWFQSLGDKLVDMGSPMANGFVIRSDGTTAERASSLNGYSVIRVDDEHEALDLVKNHPFLAGGSEYTIEVFDVPRK